MKKTMFKRIFAGIAAVFTLGLCVPTGFTNIITQPSFEAVAEDDGWTLVKGVLTVKNNTTINERQFIFDSSINEVKIGDKCNIGESAFYGCSALTSVKIGKECKFTARMSHFPNSAFENCATLTSVEIGEGCDIGEDAFRDCKVLTNVTIGNSCTVNTSAFDSCTSLTNVAFGDSCTIGETAFWECTALESVTIGNSCTVNMYAFLNCTSLTNVTFRDRCTIGRWAFDDCNSIEKVTFYGGLTENVKVDAINPDIIHNKSRWTICDHDFDANHKCKITECGYECKHDKFNTYHQCTICGYFDEAATQAEIDANEAEIKQKENEIKQKENEIKQKENEITQKQERNAYLKSLLNEQEKNTASTFSDGSVLAVIGGSTFLILCGLAAVIIVKRRKKTQ